MSRTRITNVCLHIMLLADNNRVYLLFQLVENKQIFIIWNKCSFDRNC